MCQGISLAELHNYVHSRKRQLSICNHPACRALAEWHRVLQDDRLLAVSGAHSHTFCHEPVAAHILQLLKVHPCSPFASMCLLNAVPKPGASQSAELETAVLAVVAPEEQLLAPPRAFADIPSLLAAIKAADFHSVQCTCAVLWIANLATSLLTAAALQMHIHAVIAQSFMPVLI